MEVAKQSTRFLELMHRYGPALKRLVSGYADSQADREDLLQEIALQLWRALPAFRGQSTERTWLYRVAHNTAITALHKRIALRTRETTAEDPAAETLHRDTEIEERRRLLVKAIRQLDPLDRQIVLLHFEELSYSEIEEITGLSVSAIGARLTRARERLAESIRKGADNHAR